MLPFRPGVGWQTLLLLCALAYCIDVASSEGRVVCYYTNWSVYRPGTAKFNPQNINPYLCTHLVYAFGGFTKDNQMKPFDKYQDIEQGGYAKFTGLKTYNKQLKTMIAIGGWNEASSRFSPLVASADRRQQFIKNILKFLRQNHFDGIDLDWEYPAHREGGKSRDRDNYAQFVQELRSEFEREAEKTGRSRLLLTMAVPAGIEYIDKGYDVPKLNKYLDWFNVLTYDFHSSHEPSVNHHAPLYSLEDDSEYNYDAELNIDYSIKYYLKAGADRDKLVLGIPTYGRSYTLINEESTELGAPSEGPGEQGDATREKGYLAYYEICQTLKEDPEWTVVQPNENVMGPYAYRRNQWVGYDDEAIVRKKAEYVVAHGLGGIMFWAIDNDDFRGTCSGKPYPLIEAAKEAMLEAFGTVNNYDNDSDNVNNTRHDDVAGIGKTRLSKVDRPKVSANNSQTLLDPSTNTQPTTPKSNTTNAIRTQSIVDLDVAGNGGNILRHDVVSTSTLSTKDDDQHTEIIKHTRRPTQIPAGTVRPPNSFNVKDKDSRRYAGKRLAVDYSTSSAQVNDTNGDGIEEPVTTPQTSQITTSRSYQNIARTYSRVEEKIENNTKIFDDVGLIEQTTIAEDESVSSGHGNSKIQVTNETDTASNSSGKRNYQSISRTSTRGSVDKQVPYTSIVRDSSGAHLSEDSSSSFMRNLGEVNRSEDNLPIQRGGLITETTIEDENIAAEIIDDEPPVVARGKTIAPALNDSSDDSNTATEQESREIATEGATLRKNLLTTLLSNNVEISKVTTLGADVEAGSENNNTSELASTSSEMAKTVQESTTPAVPDIESSTTTTTEQSVHTTTTAVPQNSNTSQIESLDKDVAKVKSQTSFTEKLSTKSVDPHPRRSSVQVQRTSTTETAPKTTTTTAYTASTRRSTVRSEIRTAKATTASATDAGEDEDLVINSTTPHSRRRVIVRGNYRPRKEGDLSSLLAADENKRVRYNHQQAPQQPYKDQELTDNYNTTAVPKSEDISGIADKNLTRAKLNNRASLGTVRNRTSSQTESLGNGLTRTRTTYVRTIDNGKVVKRVHTKTVQEKPAEYEYISDEVSEPVASTTARTVTRNRGSVKFRSNDLSSLLSLDFAPKGKQTKQSQPTVTKTRRRLLKKPKETIEHEEVKEFVYDDDNDVDDSELETTTRQSAVTTVRPRLRPTRPSTTISPPTIASTTPQSAVVDKKEFQRPTSKANTDQSTRTTPTRRKLTFKRPVATTIPSVSTTTTTTEEPTTSSQQPVAKQNIFRLRTSSTTTTTTNKPSTTDISDDLKDLQNNLTNELNSIQTVSNKTAIVSFTPAAEPGRETSHDDKLSLPIYHRRKYYQYVKDSPITYIDKSPEPADVESVTVNIQQQIHDVFNVSDNGKPTNSLEEDENISDDDDHRLAMEQAREINSELSHFLLKTPGSLSVETNAASDINSYRQGKTFKSKLTTAGRNETKRIIQLSILADAQQVTNDSRALRTYSRLNRKRPNLTTNPDSDDEAREVNDLETTTKSAPSLAQLFGGRRNKTTATAGQDSNTRRVNGSFNKLLSTTTPRQNLSINQRVSSENSANSAPDFDSVTYSSDEHSDENELLAELADENDVVSNEDMTTLSSSSTTGIGTAVISREHTLRSRFNTTTIGMSNTTYEESREIEQFENNVGLNIADLPSTTTVKTIGSPTPRRQILQRNRSNTDVQNITTNTGVYNDVSASKINAPDLGESTSASTETASGRPTYKRRKVIIRNRLNATKSASFTNNAGSNEAKDDEEKSRNGTEYTTPTSETKSNQNPRYQLLLRRGNTTTITTASVKQINEVNEDEDSADVINSSGDGEVIGETIELTTSRRNLLIRRRFNATAPTSKAKTSAEQNSNTEKYNAVNGTESTTLAPTTTSGRSALRRQSLVRRRYNSTTAASQNDIQEDKDNSEEISGFGNIQLTTAVPRNNRNRPTQPRDLLKQRRFNKTSTEGSAKEITTPGTDKEVDVSTRRPYATLSRTRNRFSVSRESTTTEKLISDADSDDDNDASTDDNIGDKTPDSDSLTVRGGFVQTNRHRALLRPQLSQIPATKKGEQDSQNIGRKPPNFGTRRTPAPQTKFSSSTLRSIVAVNRNLYNREDANQHENQQLDEEDDDYDNNVEDNEEDDVELEEAVDQKLSSRTSSSILGQLLASRQRIANTNTETVKTENPTKILTLIQRQHGDSTDDNDDDEDEDVDEDGDNGDNDDNEDDDVDIDNMQDNDTIEHVTENNITQPNIRNYTYQSTSYRASHNYGTSRGNSTVANYLNNSFKFSNANKNKNKNNNSTDSKNTYTNKQFEDTVGNAKNNDETKDDDSLEADIDIEETDKNNNDNENGAPERNLSDIGNDVNSKRRFQNRYQVSRTRGPTTTTTARPTASTTTAKSTTRRLSFGSRSRVQVTKISNIDDVSTEKTEESEEDDDATETTTVPTTITTATTTTATTSGKPKLKRIRVLKYRRPLQPIDSSNSTASTTNSASSTYTENTNHTITIANNTTNPIKNTPAKKFRKIVRKLRPVETTTESNKLATDEPSSEDQQTVAGETTTTTRKPFLPSHSRFGAAQHVEPGKDADEDSTDSQKQSVQPERRPVDLQRLRNRLKSQQSRGEPTDGVINSRLRGKDDKNIDEENESEGNSTLQQLRDKVKAEQARGSGEQGVINDRLKQLLVERTPLSTTTTPDNDDVELNVSSSTPASSQRPVFRRKLVAKRPYAPSAATTPTKAALVFSSTRPTAKFVRRKNGRYDPFNSNVRNRGEGFVRSDPRGARLPGADRFKQEQKEIDVDGEDADYEQQQEHPQPLINTSPLGSQVAVRRPFIPKNKQPEQDQENAKSEEEYDDDDEDEDEDNEDEDEEEEQPSKQQGQEPVSSQEQQLGDSTSKPQFHTPPAYRPKDNRVPPGNRPNFAPTASGPNANGGNVPFNPRNRQTNFSTVGSSSSAPVNRFGGSNRPRVVNRPPGVATPNLTLRPVANNYERTTPLTPLKPAPFIPSNNRSYERKYTGPSTETPEITSENPLIEDLNIDALNARNKKIFDIHSKKHTTLKPKVAAKTDAELETEVVESEDAYDQLQQRQGYVTTTPTTPTTNPTSTQSTDTTNTETETAQPQIVFHEYANEATNISSPPQDKAQATLSLTTLPPPPATTLLHVFTLVEGENEEEQEPTGRPLGSKTTAVEPKHKLIEINRIVEINSKQTKAAQRKSKANQDFGTLRVESLPHVEQLGEISVVKYVHLVDGSDIQINDGHSTVADYTPTEPSVPKNSAPVRNSLPQTEGDFELDRSGKSLLPEVIREAFETSTISLEGLFDSARKAKQLSIDTNNAVDRNADTTPLMDTDLDTINTTVPPTAASALPATYVRPIVPLLRPESNESSPLIISIANLDKVILSKVQASEGESDANAANGIEDSSTLLPPSSINAPSLAPDSNSAFSVRHASVLQAPSNQLSDLSDKHNSYAQTTFTLTNGAISGSSNNNNDSQTQTATTYTNISNISEKISYSSETHVVRRKKARRGRGRRPMKRQRNAKTTTTTATTTTLRTQTVPSTTTATAAAAAGAGAAAAAVASVSRRPVLSVRRRIINTPTAASESTTQTAELTTTSKYNRLRSKPATTTAAATAKNSNSYLSKLKSSSATLPFAPSSSSSSNSNSSNTINQNKFQAASYALRRQFQTRRLTTTASSTSVDENATDAPRTQNPLFKRRLTLTSTATPPRISTTALSIDTTTYLPGIEDDNDQVARSSIHTSRFNHISEHLRPGLSFELPNSISSVGVANITRRQMIPRPRRPQSATPTPSTTAATVTAASSPPASRRQQSRRRPHKYIEVYSRPPSKPEVATATSTANRRSGVVDHEIYDQNRASVTKQSRRRNEPARLHVQGQSQSQPKSQTLPKVIVHGQGIIECLDQGNFPHPLNCRKFISCAKFDGTGGIVGWEYTCPKGLGYDGDSGMCTWAAAGERACHN
ncbi:uncharacterized protein Dvir_GJ18726 [Drosophila virilis]|uniref:chitinase n=1 Tax=Drosophila virilis TaxID=7244 RepID=B4M245_DROVI|nr:uncharacterized protein Dvir_GJ18726 [Drosophila virilis]